MKLPAWLQDTAERAIKTASQTLLASLGVGAAHTGIQDLPWVAALSVSATATVLSVLMSLGSLSFGSSGTASLTTAVEPAGTPS